VIDTSGTNGAAEPNGANPEADATGFTMGGPPPETDDEAVARLAALPPLEYDRDRVPEAERLGCRVATLDAAVKAARAEKGAGAAGTGGHTVRLPEIEPWAHPVGLAEVLDELAEAIRRHIVLTIESATAAALWIAHTWIFDQFDFTPRLSITSPMKRCGKSTLLEILRQTCRRPLKADNISPSGVFRTVEAFSPMTLLLDEVDAFARENEELRGVLNAGCERSGQVVRVVEQNGQHVPVGFKVFCPAALAAIGSIPSTLADRSVPIRMERKAASEQVTRLRDAGARNVLATIARKLARWAADHGGALPLNPHVPSAMGDREGDISTPLLAIAEAAAGAWPDRTRRALLMLFGLQASAEATAEHGTQLLSDIRDYFRGMSAERATSKELCEHLGKLEERPWPEWRAGKPITPPQLANALRPFGIRPGTIRTGTDTAKGYYREAFAEVWSRYLAGTPTTASSAATGSAGRHTVTTKESLSFPGDFSPLHDGGRDGLQNGLKANDLAGCDDVTAPNLPPSVQGGVTTDVPHGPNLDERGDNNAATIIDVTIA
jgi:putative DNA primase/helicase